MDGIVKFMFGEPEPEPEPEPVSGDEEAEVAPSTSTPIGTVDPAPSTAPEEPLDLQKIQAKGSFNEAKVSFNEEENGDEEVGTRVTVTVDVEVEPPELYLEECFRDHFTLSTPSTLVRFRSTNTAARVFENKTSQFILEEKFEEVSQRRRIDVKLLSDGTNGLQFLRLIYTIMCVFWSGIFFALCLQILLIMVLEMAIEVGSTQQNPTFHPGRFIGIILGIFVFCFGFSQALVIAGAFVKDTWTGHYLVKLFFFRNRYGNVTVDWIFFCFFVLFPVLVMCITLLMGQENWWAITMLFWFACVSLSFLVFAINSVYFEVQGAFHFLSKRPDMVDKRFWIRVKECVLLKQRRSFSGFVTCQYLARSVTLRTDIDGPLMEDSILEWSREERTGPWARLTKLGFLQKISLYSPIEPPQPLYTIDDVQDNRPYVTKHTWSLERLFCRPRNSRYIFIIGGPGALTQHQMRSSLVCSFIGVSIFFLLILSFLIYMEFSALLVLAIMVVGALASIPIFNDLRRLIKVTNKVFTARKEESQKKQLDAPAIDTPTPRRQSRRESEITEESNEGIFIVAQKAMVTRPSDHLCWIATAVEIILFFFYPMAVLFYVRNFRLASLFIIVAAVSLIRYYVDLVAVVEETGQLSLVSGATTRIRWSQQSRLNDLMEAISYNKTRRLWQLILSGCGLFLLVVFLTATGDSVEPTVEDAFTFADGFAWTPQPDDVRYGTCDLSKSTTFGVNSTLADFSFLSNLAYKKDEVVDSMLQEWFSPATDVVEDRETVTSFREDNDLQNSPVYFRLFRFKKEDGNGDRGVISIRGTTNSWDILADFQLWSAAVLTQGIRAVLPLGEMWTPILSQVVKMMSIFQKGSVDAVSFYKVTTSFTNQLKSDPSFDNLQLTGHSLGGGLAMISSAQTHVPSVALSGPNAMISGRSFEPQVSPDELNKYTFNIVPDRDLVPKFDDVAKNFQNIRCTAAQNKFPDCHYSSRSLCEIVYTCGNGNRPTICNCVYEYQYPVPASVDPTESRSFEQVCKDNGYVKPEDKD